MAPAGLKDFEGRWRLDRVIDDRMAGVEGRMTGEVVFLPAPGGLRCAEEGRLVYGGAEMEARRVYLWRAVPEGIAVDYEDGRPFHAFALSPLAEAAHDCAPDLYHVRYDFTAWPDWRAEWRVTGPRKDYLSVSRYRRTE